MTEIGEKVRLNLFHNNDSTHTVVTSPHCLFT